MKKLLALIATVILAVNVQAGEYPDISIGDLETAADEEPKLPASGRPGLAQVG